VHQLVNKKTLIISRCTTVVEGGGNRPCLTLLPDYRLTHKHEGGWSKSFSIFESKEHYLNFLFFGGGRGLSICLHCRSWKYLRGQEECSHVLNVNVLLHLEVCWGGLYCNITYQQDYRIAYIDLENVRCFLILRLFNDNFRIHEPDNLKQTASKKVMIKYFGAYDGGLCAVFSA
jgi:hypothetical protein